MLSRLRFLFKYGGFGLMNCNEVGRIRSVLSVSLGLNFLVFLRELRLCGDSFVLQLCFGVFISTLVVSSHSSFYQRSKIR